MEINSRHYFRSDPCIYCFCYLRNTKYTRLRWWTLFHRATHMRRRTVQVLKWSVRELDTALWLTVWLLGQEWRTALWWVLRRFILS